jgi:hypothetical protein
VITPDSEVEFQLRLANVLLYVSIALIVVSGILIGLSV